MAMFYFDRNSDIGSPDEDGAECADEAAAQKLARRALAEWLTDDIHRLNGIRASISVRNADGITIYAVSATVSDVKVVDAAGGA